MLLLHPLTVLRSSDVTEGHRASCRRRQDTIFHPPGLPAQVILWDCCCCCIHGNEPLQLPSTLAPLTGWLACMDEACALPWLVLSVPGMGSGSTLQKTQLAVCTPPPPHHAHACCIPHDWILQDPETVLSCKVNVSARMSHWLTCNAGISLCTGHPKKKKRICKIRIWMSNQTFVRAVKTDRSYIIVFSSLVSQSYFHYFLNLPFFFFLQVTPSEGAPFKDVRWKENILCTTLSAVTFALSFDSPLPLSQPSSPDKKEPLLRCFARHYKTVAMDTQSEQAPHTGSRIGNDRCNISHL